VVSGFEAAMDDDFNTAGALAQLFDLVRAIHLAREAGAGTETVAAAQPRSDVWRVSWACDSSGRRRARRRLHRWWNC